MKREFPPALLAASLVLGCVVLRLLNDAYPEIAPNFSPQMAVAFVGAIYLPRAWGWLVGPVAFVATDLAFAETNHLTDTAMFSWFTLFCALFYMVAGLLGASVAPRRTLGRVIAGSLACSLFFYVAANSFSWWHNPDYPATWAGWWQSNTFGLPGYIPTWHFLRNALAGDLIFALLLVGLLEPTLVTGRFQARTAPHAA